MQDQHRRSFAYLRLSLTAACQMRCVYCRPEWLRNCDQVDRLTPSDIETVVRHLVNKHSLRKVRLTGGDPTARTDLLDIIQRLAGIDGLHDLAMTTNGLTLARDAAGFRSAGLHRVNVSLDSLDRRTFHHMTGVDGLPRVLAGIDAALAVGLAPLRLNTVVLAGINDHELPDLVAFAAAQQVEIRFIELMPMGPLAHQWDTRYVPASAMRQSLDTTVADWQPVAQHHDSASRYRVRLHDGRTAVVGFITPMSCSFCHACDRLRLTADGKIYPCLMDEPRGSFLSALRPRFDGDRFDQLLRQAMRSKAAEHPIVGTAVMTTIGG